MGFTVTEQEPNDNVASFAKNAKGSNSSKLKKAAIIAGSVAGVGAVGLGGAKAIKALKAGKKAKAVVATGTAAEAAVRSQDRYVTRVAKTRDYVATSTGSKVPITRKPATAKKSRMKSLTKAPVSRKSDISALTKTERAFPELVTNNPPAKIPKVKGKLRSGSDVKLSTVKRKAEAKKFDSAKAKLSAITSPSKRQANSNKVAKRLETISNDSRLQTLLSSSQRNSKRLQSTKDLKVPNDVQGNAVLQKRRNTKDNLKLTKADLKRRLNDMRSRGEYSSALAAVANF
jgi:hypothetical protein